MLTDISSCHVSLTDPRALEAWNGVIHGVLSHSQSTGTYLTNLLALAPDFAMGHAIKGLSCLMLGRCEMIEPARAAAQEAQRALALGGATERERLWCAALVAWLNGHPSRAVRQIDAALALNLADTLSMKLGHGIRFMLGDNAGMLRSISASMAAHDRDHPLYGYAMGCQAFALEETGQYRAAERVGLAGLAYAPDDAWGLHAVAHVYEMTHHVKEGIALIDQNHAAWGHCNNFRFHVWWHKALLHLDQGEFDTVFDLYDTKIRAEKTDDYRDISNATSLLMRLELEGQDVGHRWQELADLAERRTEDGTLTFADMHYMLALLGDDRRDGATRLTASVAAHAAKGGEMAQVMAAPGRATAEGLAAFGAGNYTAAFAQLRTGQPDFCAMGGSHAQRDVFERLTIEAGVRAGQLAEAERLLRARQALRGGQADSFYESRMAQISAARAARSMIHAGE